MTIDLTPDDALERFLQATIRGLRKLPAGTGLNVPTSPDDAQLLHELLQLPDDVDPIGWVHASRPAVAARLALKGELLKLRTWLAMAGYDRGPRLDDSIVVQTFMGSFVVALASEAVGQLSEDTNVGEEQLRHILQELALSMPARENEPSSAVRNRGLYPQLLRLPRGIDPIEWLGREHGHWVAVAATRRVIDLCLPSRKAGIGKELRRTEIQGTLGQSAPYSIKSIEFALGSAGFRLTIHLVIHPEVLRDYEAAPASVVARWNGFDRVSDDRGNHYVTLSMQDRGSPGNHETTAVFFPRVDPTAKRLTFNASPATVALFGLTDRGPASHLRRLALSDLTLAIDVPSAS